MTSFAELAEYKLCYLATPYSKFKHGLHMAHVEACRYAAGLIQAGVSVYSPIAHSHPIALYGQIDPLDHGIWLSFDEAIMRLCDALIVAEVDGWMQSKGIQYEIDFFGSRNKPIHYLPGDCFA